jgi:hypothetical protein
MPREREEEVWETTGRWDGSEAVVPPRPRMRRLDLPCPCISGLFRLRLSCSPVNEPSLCRR